MAGPAVATVSPTAGSPATGSGTLRTVAATAAAAPVQVAAHPSPTRANGCSNPALATLPSSLDSPQASPRPQPIAVVVLLEDTLPGLPGAVLRCASATAVAPGGGPGHEAPPPVVRVRRVSAADRAAVIRAVIRDPTAAWASLVPHADMDDSRPLVCAPEWLLRAATASSVPLAIVASRSQRGVVVGTSAVVECAADFASPSSPSGPTVPSADAQALRFVLDLDRTLRGQPWFRPSAVSASFSSSRLAWMRASGSVLMCLQDGVADPALQMAVAAGTKAPPTWLAAALELADELGVVLPGGLQRWGLGALAVCSA